MVRWCGKPNAGNGLRSFGTGVDIGAIAKYWGLGDGAIPEITGAAPTAIPPGTWVPVDDNDKDISYSGKWTYVTTSPGYYRMNCHFSSAAGSACRVFIHRHRHPMGRKPER